MRRMQCCRHTRTHTVLVDRSFIRLIGLVPLTLSTLSSLWLPCRNPSTGSATSAPNAKTTTSVRAATPPSSPVPCPTPTSSIPWSARTCQRTHSTRSSTGRASRPLEEGRRTSRRSRRPRPNPTTRARATVERSVNTLTTHTSAAVR